MQLDRLLRDESGATAIEYSLIAGLVGVAIILALTFLGSSLTQTYDNVSAVLGSAGNG